jgi:hypothetical protein
MVDASPLRQQRPLHVLPHRDRLPALRQLMLRLGSTIKGIVGSTGFLVSDRPTTSHHMEGVEGRATRRPFVLTPRARPQSTPARRQPSSGGGPQSPNFEVPGYDERASQTLGTHQHQQHQHSRATYSLRGQGLGRQTEP